MLTEKRYELILELLDKKRSVTVPEIKDVLGVSESTIRRDLNALDKAGRLTKVFGGAVSSDGTFTGTESGRGHDDRVYLRLSSGAQRYVCDECGIACQTAGSRRKPSDSDRR